MNKIIKPILALLLINSICLTYKNQELRFLEEKPVCHDLSDGYLTLYKPTFSQFTCPWTPLWSRTGSTLRTTFTRIKVNPQTLIIDTGDYTYATADGLIKNHPLEGKNIPLGTAFSCDREFNENGIGRIDLRGTGFALDGKFQHRGLSEGSAEFSNDDQVIDLKCGGDCGWIAPVGLTCKNEAYKGGKILRLRKIYSDNECVIQDTKPDMRKPCPGIQDGYLELQEENFSQYTIPENNLKLPGDSTIRTTFTKIKVSHIDEDNLLVDTSDFTYSSSYGKISIHKEGVRTRCPFGTAHGCLYGVADGIGKINMQGTGYAIDNKFEYHGYDAIGSANFNSNDQIVELQAGGGCGWIASSLSKTSDDAVKGGQFIKLRKIYNDPLCRHLEVCEHGGSIRDAVDGRNPGKLNIIYTNTQTGETFAPKVEGSNYKIAIPEGIYKRDVSLEGYIDNSQTINVDKECKSAPKHSDILLTKPMPPQQVRIVLTWDEKPTDLDSILVTPSEEFLFWRNKKAENSKSWLDIDDSDGHGPETFTINDLENDGEFKFFVNRYSTDGELRESNAVVHVYSGDKHIGEFHVDPKAEGTFWYVCNVNMKKQKLTKVDEYE